MKRESVASQFLKLILRMVASCVAGSAVQLYAQTLGTMNMGGNPDFSSDSIAQTEGPERRWHSFPGGRLSLNPSAAKTFVIDPTPADLALDLGGYVGSGILRLPKVAGMSLLDSDGKELTPASQRTDWFPHKLTVHSQHPGGALVCADDFFVDTDSSLLRVIDVSNAAAQRLHLSGATPDKASLEWQAEKKALLVTGSYLTTARHYRCFALIRPQVNPNPLFPSDQPDIQNIFEQTSPLPTRPPPLPAPTQ